MNEKEQHRSGANVSRRLAALSLTAAATLLPLFAPGAATAALTPAFFGSDTRQVALPDFADLAEAVKPTVVNISVKTTVERTGFPGAMPFPFEEGDPFYEFFRRFGIPMPIIPNPHGPGGAPEVRRGVGSGFVISSDGYILTNAHVVSDEEGGKTELTVRLADGREFPAKVVGVDKRTDVAVVKIDAQNLPTVRFGDPQKARVGEWVIAVGAPFGLDQTVTAGIISAKSRRLPDETYVPFLQTDVAINPGNSGGPLFNLKGEVIGINSMIYSRSGGYMGISFAIPIDVALKVKDQLIQYGRVQRGKLGVVIQGLDEELAQSFGLDKPRGALVAQVEPESPAARAGIEVGDIIVSVDGTEVKDSGDLPRMIGERRPGEKVTIGLLHQGKRLEKTVTLAELDEGAATNPGKMPSNDADFGLSVRPLSPQEQRNRGVEGGVMVTAATGPAAQAGIQPGDIILAVNQKRIETVADLKAALARTGKRAALLIDRDGTRLFIAVKR
uniref:Probable periplasmic serine endoprotease DegP-like n=1 Tax=uncultured beta proteobacterium TaxID=86027 RepID=H5SNY4_9PROT|nr:serine protease MucD [uncultured beta proteobacterium]